MGKSLDEIAQELKDSNKKVQLIYAFNGTGKTRLSRAFKELVAPKNQLEEEAGLASKRYYIIMPLRKIYFIGIMIWITILI